MSLVVSQLRNILEKAKNLKLPKVCTGEQLESLSCLSEALESTAKTLREEVQQLRESRKARAWRESEKHRVHAQSSVRELLASRQFKQPYLFQRTIKAIFKGPQDSAYRMEATSKRCEQIRKLSPDGIISWAISFAPTIWAGGSMSWDVFDCLIDSIESKLTQQWPSVVADTLHFLSHHEECLKTSSDYKDFLEG
jgi:hypothetical protein